MSGSPRFSQPLFLAGPTAVGKSEVALLLAEQIGGEIISVDSMQIYRGLDIGTAKPTPSERQRVLHHLIDVVELTESFDAAQFARRAHQAVREILARRRIPLLCGGTGLYFKAFLEGLGEAPPPDPLLRAELEATPISQLWQELKQRDPKTFESIDRHNLRRVIRAVEVTRLTGKPFSAQRSTWSSQGAERCGAKHFVGIARAAPDLHLRIDKRVEEMFQRGLVAETEKLLHRGLAQNKTALQAIGYRQVVEFLRGQRSLEDTIALVKLRTHQFAKRQMTWFRRQAVLTWINLEPHERAENVAARLAEIWSPDA